MTDLKITKTDDLKNSKIQYIQEVHFNFYEDYDATRYSKILFLKNDYIPNYILAKILNNELSVPLTRQTRGYSCDNLYHYNLDFEENYLISDIAKKHFKYKYLNKKDDVKKQLENNYENFIQIIILDIDKNRNILKYSFLNKKDFLELFNNLIEKEIMDLKKKEKKEEENKIKNFLDNLNEEETSELIKILLERKI